MKRREFLSSLLKVACAIPFLPFVKVGKGSEATTWHQAGATFTPNNSRVVTLDGVTSISSRPEKFKSYNVRMWLESSDGTVMLNEGSMSADGLVTWYTPDGEKLVGPDFSTWQ